MYKNQLQELAQRSCFNLPSYTWFREGPDHAPRFRASVNFNGEIFEAQNYSPTLRQAEHAAAEVALNALSSRCPSRSLTARVLDETGVYKNLLQETAHRSGLKLPVYATVRSGPGHLPLFTCTVSIGGIDFTGVSAKTKKQAEKNAAIAAWSSLKTTIPSFKLPVEEEDQIAVSRVLSSIKVKDDSKLAVKRWDHNNRGKSRRWDYNKDHNFASSSTKPPVNRCLNAEKQSSFLNTLPPPPPRTFSKILNLPPPPLMEEHQRDEEEWLGKKNDYKFKTSPSIEKKGCMPINSNSYVSNNNVKDGVGQMNQIRSRLIGPSSPMCASAIKTRPVYNGGLFNPNSRFAQAVQIRSVIPVCAAAPPTPTATPMSLAEEKSLISSKLVRTETGPGPDDEQSLISSKLDKLSI